MKTPLFWTRAVLKAANSVQWAVDGGHATLGLAVRPDQVVHGVLSFIQEHKPLPAIKEDQELQKRIPA